ncbi:MAG: YfdX family protein [Burkholderiales bacterium]|nr:YfdX family protein [Burkholderiales bacterium]
MSIHSFRRTRTSAALIALSVALASGAAFTSPVFAAQGKDQVVEASKAGTAHPNLKLSQDGYSTMRAVRAARVAIFNGDIDAAKKLVDEAGADVGRVKVDERALDKTTPGNWIPIDGQLGVADDFVSTPQKAAHIASGNKKLQEGKVSEAMQEFKLAEVDINFSRVLMPLDATRRQVALASDLMKGQKYYEANMALKAAEDGLQFDSVTLIEAPKGAGNAAAAAPAAKSASAPAAPAVAGK